MTEPAQNDHIAQLLTEILQTAHPIMAEAIYVAAIPQWYTQPLFAAIRKKEDGRDEKLVTHYLPRYSFVVPLSDQADDDLAYTVRAYERDFIHKYWIKEDPKGYKAAHQRALAYWEANPDTNPYAQAQQRLYHLLLVDEQAGINYLVERFRVYYGDRQFAAIQRLLETVQQAYNYLVLLNSPFVSRLKNLSILLEARLAQLYGRWSESLSILEPQLKNANLGKEAIPYVMRVYGAGLAGNGQYVEAIETYEAAIKGFQTLANTPENEAERAQALIDLGDAYVDLAVSARGYVHQEKGERIDALLLLNNFVDFFLSIPLVIYLSFYLGLQVWRLRFWPVFRDLDWIIARLFAQGARCYRMADPILEKYGTLAEGAIADEKLAHLYLKMGATKKAQILFAKLLSANDVSLGDYRQASTRVGLGETWLQQGELSTAQHEFETALPVLRLFEDIELQAEVHRGLAQTFDTAKQNEAACVQWQQALSLYRQQDNVRGMTRAIEALEQLGDAKTAETIDERFYPVRYRHVATYVFKRLSAVLLLVLLFLIPISSIQIETNSTILPEITFEASPLLRADDADFTPELSEGVTGSRLAPPDKPNVLFLSALSLLLGYLTTFAVAGFIAISTTPLRRLQESSVDDTIHIDDTGIQVGQGESAISIKWQDISRLTRADVQIFRGFIPDISLFIVESSQSRLVVPGRTYAYDSLTKRIQQQAPTTVKPINLSFNLFRSKMGFLYIFTGILIFIVFFLSPTTPTLGLADFIGVYSLADIYPYLYLGLVIPIFWWFLIRPSQTRVLSSETGPVPYWFSSISITLTVAYILTQFHPWLAVPDIYPGLVALVLIGCAVYMFWRGVYIDNTPMYSLATRWIITVVAVCIVAIFSSYFWREVRGYHYLVTGHYWRDQALMTNNTGERDDKLQQSVVAYSKSKGITQLPILGIDGRGGSIVPISFVPAHRTTWISSINGRAVTYMLRGNFQSAIIDYTEILPYTDLQARTYASRAIAYQGLGTFVSGPLESSAIKVEQTAYDLARENYDEAIRLDPEDAAYYLWRGFGSHVLHDTEQALTDYETALAIKGDKELSPAARVTTLTGKGWIHYMREEYELAASFFQAAVDIGVGANRLLAQQPRWRTPTPPISGKALAQANLGLGYAYYSLRQYNEALAAWEDAASQNPADPLIYISLGTLHWRIGTLGEDLNASGENRCLMEYFPLEERLRSQAEWEMAVDLFDQSLSLEGQSPEEMAFTHHAKTQVLFLLEDCPDYN